MYNGSLKAESNRATWTFVVTVLDTTTDVAIDLTAALIELAVRSQQSVIPAMTGSSADGHIAILSPATAGQFRVTFTPAEMGLLLPGIYDVGIRLTQASGTVTQLLVAELPLVDGIIAL